MRTRAGIIIVATAVLVTACGGALEDPTVGVADESPQTSSTTGEQGVDTPRPASGAFPEGPSALDNVNDPSFPQPLVDTSQIISGGPPPDGIPPIDDPVFVDVADNLQLLPATEPVVALEIDGDARAYPIRAMVWHEIVNDTVGGVPVSVTYCPLCNSAATYVREVDGAETTFDPIPVTLPEGTTRAER